MRARREPEGGCGVRAIAGGEIGAESTLGEAGLAVDLGERGRSVDESGGAGAIQGDGAAEGLGCVVGLRAARVESAEVGPGVGLVGDCGCRAELALGCAVVLLLFGGHGANAMRVLREMGLRVVGKASRFVEAAADDGWSVDVVLAEVVDGAAVIGIETDGSLEGVANFESKTEAGDGAGVVGLHAVSAASPVLRGAVARERAERGAALGYCGRGEGLRVEGAAEEEVCLAVAGVCGDDLLELSDGGVGMAGEKRGGGGGKVRSMRGGGKRDEGEATERERGAAKCTDGAMSFESSI